MGGPEDQEEGQAERKNAVTMWRTSNWAAFKRRIRIGMDDIEKPMVGGGARQVPLRKKQCLQAEGCLKLSTLL